MHDSSMLKSFSVLVAAATLLPLSAPTYAGGKHHSLETIYTMSNDPNGNHVIALRQGSDGRLVSRQEFATQGLGTGGGLGNQSALASDGEYLFVVNAGSDDMSVFKTHHRGLRLVDQIPSGGVRPVSVTVNGNLVYVLNAGSDSIAGFTLSDDGRLEALPGSEQPLSGAGVDAAQIQFSHEGRSLIVTEKATNLIVTFLLDRAGVPVKQQVFPSAGQTPFGFALAKGRNLVVSDAAGGAPNASTVSSYRIRRDGSLRVLDGAVPTHQSAACWVAVTPDGRFAYTTNTASDSLSAYRVWGNGRLTLLQPDGIAARVGSGGTPIDMTFSDQGEYLHVLNSGHQSITTFRVGRNGKLSRIGSVSGLPAGVNGLVAF